MKIQNLFNQVKLYLFYHLYRKGKCPAGHTQSQDLSKNRASGCRSEVLMDRKLFLFLTMFAALATNQFAQTNNFQAPSATKVIGGGDISDFDRPRLADEKAEAVKSLVIVNTVEVERIAFEMLNQKRVESRLQPLVWSDEIAVVARVHSQNMAEFQFFSHRGLDNKMVSDRADKAGLGKWRSIGENIAYNRGYKDPIAKAVQLWLDSPTHKHNLLDCNWRESAVGVAIAEDGSYYFTQVFLVRK